jgi:hypothetical protein
MACNGGLRKNKRKKDLPGGQVKYANNTMAVKK